jgi:hypothetical protein
LRPPFPRGRRPPLLAVCLRHVARVAAKAEAGSRRQAGDLAALAARREPASVLAAPSPVSLGRRRPSPDRSAGWRRRRADTPESCSPEAFGLWHPGRQQRPWRLAVRVGGARSPARSLNSTAPTGRRSGGRAGGVPPPAPPSSPVRSVTPPACASGRARPPAGDRRVRLASRTWGSWDLDCGCGRLSAPGASVTGLARSVPSTAISARVRGRPPMRGRLRRVRAASATGGHGRALAFAQRQGARRHCSAPPTGRRSGGRAGGVPPPASPSQIRRGGLPRTTVGSPGE